MESGGSVNQSSLVETNIVPDNIRVLLWPVFQSALEGGSER